MTEKEFKKAFGKNIKSIRIQKGIKQKVLAELIGIAETNLSRVENGKDFVKAGTIINLARELNCSYKDLFDFEIE